MYRFFGTGSATLQEDLVDEAVEIQMPTKETAELNPKEEKKAERPQCLIGHFSHCDTIGSTGAEKYAPIDLTLIV